MGIFNWFKRHTFSPAVEKADTAIKMADELTVEMKRYSSGDDPIKSLISDLWRHRNNVPFVTTVYEAIQEVKPYSGNGYTHHM